MEKYGLRWFAEGAELVCAQGRQGMRISIPPGHRIEVDVSASRETGGLAGETGAPFLDVTMHITPIAGIAPPEVRMSNIGDREALPAATEPEQMIELLEAAWAVIANSGVFGNPEEPSPGCREAAQRWRDQYHETLSAWCRRAPGA